MTDTRRGWAVLQSLLANNKVRAISAQDIRDAIYSASYKSEVVLTSNGTRGPYTVNGTNGFVVGSTELFMDGVRYSKTSGDTLLYAEASDGLTITIDSSVQVPIVGAKLLVAFVDNAS